MRLGPIRDAANLSLLLANPNKQLLDRFTIVSALNLDLAKVGFKMRRPREESSSNTPRKRQRTLRKSIPKTIQEVANDTDVDDAVAAEGFVDETTGEKLFLIERIIKYEPVHGYFVHWQGYPKSERSWQKEKDMPPGFTREMKRARERYQESIIR